MVKFRTQMTLNPENVGKIDEYIALAGLSRSAYIDICMQSDVMKLDEILKNSRGSIFETRKIVIDYFKTKIGEGEC